ncbi:hypothetical protein [Variovorax paradoxus]|nr:hypothetical protein [Variovorax paradoxus]
MTPDLEARCEELLTRGRALSGRIGHGEYGPEYWFDSRDIPQAHAWIGSVANFFSLCAMPGTYFLEEVGRIVEQPELKGGAPFSVVQKLVGLLEAISEEMKQGLLRKAEYIFVASTFDDFLDHATEFHKAGKKTESAVLCSAVFEDAVRKIAEKVGVVQAGVALDAIIDALAKQGATTPVKAKRWKSYAGIRNKALHAQWDDFDIRDVGEMLTGTREIIESL